MNLHDYQTAALTTAKPTALDLENYLAPGAFAEVGELLDVFSKGHRDGHTPEQINANAVKEYGDCYWFAALGLHVRDVHEDNIPDVPGWDHRIQATRELAEIVHDIYQDPEYTNSWVMFWDSLDANCVTVTGKTPDEVKAINLAKLADRQARDVIGGSGNDR